MIARTSRQALRAPLVLSLIVVAPLTLAPLAGNATAPVAATSAQVVLDWERILFRTVYTDGLTPIPSGVPLLGFTSVTMYDAAKDALRRGGDPAAAVATAAHDVLLHYYPTAQAKLDADLAASLAQVPDGHAEVKGIRLGARAAADLIASRVDDGFNDPTIHYTLPPAVGTWKIPAGRTDMLGAWIGSLRPLVLDKLVEADGPNPITSADYAIDYNEVKALGSTTSAVRTQEQTDTALFFNSNAATMVSDALVRHLEAEPISLLRTARIFARIHGAMTDTVIKCWQLKRDVGFWRPSEAVADAALDNNPDTEPASDWAPLVANPPYSDYVSGHACATSSAVETIRRMLGEDTQLELRSVNSPTPRTYPTLTALEADAFMARIWSGLHFRDAMVDGYAIGHETARRVARQLG